MTIKCPICNRNTLEYNIYLDKWKCHNPFCVYERKSEKAKKNCRGEFIQ